MKTKKLIMLATLLILATAAPSAVAAFGIETDNFETAVRFANSEIEREWRMKDFFSTSLAGKPVNEDTWNTGVTLRNEKTKVLVFGPGDKTFQGNADAYLQPTPRFVKKRGPNLLFLNQILSYFLK